MKDEKKFIRDVKNHLNQTADQIDVKTRARLSAIRNNALEQTETSWFSRRLPMAGLAGAAAMVMLFFWVSYLDVDIKTDNLEVVEMLASEQDMDFFENMEFYAWLAESGDDAGTPNGQDG